MHRVTIVNQPAIVLSWRSTILAAALDAGVPYPHGCRSGTCGTCKSRLLEGRVEMLPHAAEALDKAEAEAGLILACRARPRTNTVVEWLRDAEDSLPPIRKVKARVRALKTVAPDITRVQFEILGQPLFFFAGQYAELSFGRGPSRAFSMANPPNDPILEFHIRHLDGVASGHVVNQLRIGDGVRLEGPYGSAYLRPHRRPVLAIAGGVGLAPIRSIVRTTLLRDAHAHLHLYFGARDEAHLYARRELSALAERHRNFRFIPVLSAPGGPTRHRTGPVHEAVAEDFPRLDRHAIHVAGPPPMVEAVKAVALERGADPDAIHSDPFVPSRDEPAARGIIGAILNLGFGARWR